MDVGVGAGTRGPALSCPLKPQHVLLHRQFLKTALRLLAPTEQRQPTLTAGTDGANVGRRVPLDAVEDTTGGTIAVLAVAMAETGEVGRRALFLSDDMVCSPVVRGIERGWRGSYEDGDYGGIASPRGESGGGGVCVSAVGSALPHARSPAGV
jgi:hypothetical protein